MTTYKEKRQHFINCMWDALYRCNLWEFRYYRQQLDTLEEDRTVKNKKKEVKK